MNFFLTFFLKGLLFIVLLFCFLVVFQFGPGGFFAGAKSEWNWVRSLLPIPQETDNIPTAEPSEASQPQAGS